MNQILYGAMKRIVFLWVCACILTACSASGRLNKKGDNGNGLKRVWLVQSYPVLLEEAKTDSLLSAVKNISTAYLYEEIKGARPQITLTLQPEAGSSDAAFDTILYLSLDKEEIKLSATSSKNASLQKGSASSHELEQAYLIPENLWISMVHARELYYRVKRDGQAIALVPGKSEKEELDEFLELSMKHRDEKFPAIPEGQVKW